MIIVMKTGSSKEQVRNVVERVEELGLHAHLSEGEERTIVGVVGAPLPPDLDERFAALDGVDNVVRITKKFKLAGWDFHPQKTIIDLGDGVTIGGEEISIIAGPCSVESEEQTISTAKWVKAQGATILRGGAYKPRTSPYEFRGLGVKGLEILAQARKETGLKLITEVMTPADVEVVGEYTDIFQIGARNAQNYLLLEEVGKAGKPVMLKRGLSMLMEEWLLAAEYVMAQGNPNVILCERGIRTFETWTRNTLDISTVSVIQSLSHLPVFIDPSHAVGKRAYVASASLAAVAAGADGLMIEVHPDPDRAMSDAAQQLNFQEFADLMPRIGAVAEAVGRVAPSGTTASAA
ncbi:MAG TPA: 3-deoxy-7-phosphoheptulonate synthase [Thermomicrobiales bacterium]|nr:3-deoxy-7-phosphoheptulonate synthase [Thermomicrobiales bacterium]